MIDGKPFPSGWRFQPAGTPHTSARQIPGDHGRSCNVEIETESGKGACDFYGARFIGSVENGAGWTIAIAMQDSQPGAPVVVYSVGACEGEIGTEKLPNVTPEHFRQHGEKSEAFRERLGIER